MSARIHKQLAALAEIQKAVVFANPDDRVHGLVHRKLCTLIGDTANWWDYEGLREAVKMLLELEQVVVAGGRNREVDRHLAAAKMAAHKGAVNLDRLRQFDQATRH